MCAPKRIIRRMTTSKAVRVAVVGAGLAGAAFARAMASAGHSVHVFDKSRRPGGRLATRRMEWVDTTGQVCSAQLDHGAVGITARSAAFQAFVEQAVRAGCLAEWAPRQASDGSQVDVDPPLYVPTPDMPALCRWLLEGATTTWSFAVDSLHKSPVGWQVASGGELYDAQFDVVVLALPPAQAAVLLNPHRRDWARHASVTPMQPCWTLMGVADETETTSDSAVDWALTRPSTGSLAWVLRNDTRPGRKRVPGQAHWMVHARSGWSRQHLEQPAAWVQQQMQAALADCLGRPVVWQHCTVHRWRYALPHAARPASADLCWCDPVQGLGVCGDFLGGCGAEGAWLSGQALSAALLKRALVAPVASTTADADTAFPCSDRGDQTASVQTRPEATPAIHTQSHVIQRFLSRSSA
jgi:renalase